MKQLTAAIGIVLYVLMAPATIQAQATGPFGDLIAAEDIGQPALKGSTVFDPLTQRYRMKGGGYNIWFNRDEFHFAYNTVRGNFIYTAQFSLENSGDPHRKLGWMVRSGKDAQASHISAVLHGDGLTALQWRELRGAFMRDPEDEIRFPKRKIDILQLERKGSTFIMRAAALGEPLQEVGRKVFTGMPDSVMAGVFICSHDPAALTSGEVWNVRLDRAVEKGLQVTSRLETVDVSTGERVLVHKAPVRFEAPNYMPDGKKLLFNQQGLLNTIDVSGGTPQVFSTGSANRNNNDHGISFDGKQLAISSHRDGQPGGGSTVYVMPLTGGEPRMINNNTPSYWHGWAPDGKSVLVVAQRGTPVYNIYRVNIKDGVEQNLTRNNAGHVDGPEFSPDGRWIYYNANESGTMQIWRMKPDGSGREQLTFDEYNNWFPHISPDGKKMAFISFPNDIDPGAHPADKHVTLRLMDLSGGGPRVIAYLYGGQGTINVPSWSPDSKRISFVSYTY